MNLIVRAEYNSQTQSTDVFANDGPCVRIADGPDAPHKLVGELWEMTKGLPWNESGGKQLDTPEMDDLYFRLQTETDYPIFGRDDPGHYLNRNVGRATV